MATLDFILGIHGLAGLKLPCAYAVLVGTYSLTDIDMNTIPPGIIDHKEWTPENGRNNALRINGLGAPRG